MGQDAESVHTLPGKAEYVKAHLALMGWTNSLENKPSALFNAKALLVPKPQFAGRLFWRSITLALCLPEKGCWPDDFRPAISILRWVCDFSC